MPWQVSSADININGFLVSLHFLLSLSYFLLHSSSIIPIPNNMLSMALRLIVTLRVTCYVYNALRLVVNYGNLKVVQPEREDKFLRSPISEKNKMWWSWNYAHNQTYVCLNYFMRESPKVNNIYESWELCLHHFSLSGLLLLKMLFWKVWKNY